MKVAPREYQQSIAESAMKKGNTLIVLPTGLGKTLIAAIVIEKFLKDGKRALMLAPTRPLVEQHIKRLKEYLDIEPNEVIAVTGEISPYHRRQLYKNKDIKIIVSTPQCINNDMQDWDGVVEQFSVIIFDEAHRSVGKYAYTHIAEFAQHAGQLIIGLTASPGGRAEKVNEIMQSLFIDNVEIRTDTEADVSKYVQPLDLKWDYVDLSPGIRDARTVIDELLDAKIETMKAFGIQISRHSSRGRLSEIFRSLVQHHNMAALGNFSVLYNAFHAAEVLETEGPYALGKFVENMHERKKRVDWHLVKAVNMSKDLEHPKMKRLRELVKERKGKKLIIFAQYRDQVQHIVDVLNADGFSAKRFLGKKQGSSKEQRETIQEFSEDKFNILVASSIGEEGIDIPSADTAIFYEPVPSEIRSIQRRGRVGRLKGGEVVILVTAGTRDEAFKWIAVSRERKMHKIIRGIKDGQKTQEKPEKKKKKHKRSDGREKGQNTLSDFL
jgi:Fanconi anemia group M protein